jgi:sulfatase modifying factor 1
MRARSAFREVTSFCGGATPWLALLCGAMLLVHCQDSSENAARTGVGDAGGVGGVAGAGDGAAASTARGGVGGDGSPAIATGGDGGTPGVVAAAGDGNDGGGGARSTAGAPAVDECPSCRLRSCDGLANNCQGESCCAEALVPGIKDVAYKAPVANAAAFDASGATVTLDPVWLDKYEVTVGRFKKFVAGYDAWRADGNPRAGAGANAAPNSGWDSHWDENWPPADAAALTTLVDCGPTFSTWHTDDEVAPMNCVNWFEAFAFCIWDGGRLPTEAEWEHAASDDQFARTYPWGDSAPNATLAVYNTGPGNAAILPVGSKPAGAGNWGHLDLAGSVSEWVFDAWAEGFPSSAICDNCARTVPVDVRVARGGSYFDVNTQSLASADRGAPELSTSARAYVLGFRCARPN